MTNPIDLILNAKDPTELFGADANEEAVREEWRRLVKLVHPDVNEDTDRAGQASARLNELQTLALAQLRTHRYGVPVWSVLTRKGRKYEFDQEPTWYGDSCNLFLGNRLEVADRIPVWVKVARSATDADLMANEMKAIRRVLASKSAVENYAYLYVAPLSDSFQVNVSGGGRRRANVFEQLPNTITMQDVRKVFPGGVHPKDAAWMFRRLLWGLGCAHDAGVVHGAVLPRHLLLTPAEHGVTLLDWRASSVDGSSIAVLSSGVPNGFYPKYADSKSNARPEFDIAMAAACMEWVCGGREKLPRALRGFFKGCRAPKLPSAWELRLEFTALIEAMWGPRIFRPFIVPEGSSNGGR